MRLSFFITVLMCFALTGCARDENAALRVQLSKWFKLEGTLFFHSKMRCTAAVYRLEETVPKNTLAIQRDIENAKRVFRMRRFSAIQMAGYSPHDLADAMLLTGDGIFGKQVLASAAQSVPCFQGSEAEPDLRRAMMRAGALLAYDPGTEGVILLDPIAARLFYFAGDVW